MFRVFLGCSGFFGSVPGFSGVPECSVMFRCSGVPEVLHAERKCALRKTNLLLLLSLVYAKSKFVLSLLKITQE